MSESLPRERLKQARIRAGYRSAAEAAKANGWAVPTYSGHENGGRGFDAELARKYAATFAVDPAWLLLGDGAGPTRPPLPKPGISMTTDGKGNARLQIDTTIPFATALRVLAMLEGGE